jgi:dihydroxyacetone kinase-like protein
MINSNQIKDLFSNWEAIMLDSKEYLIQIDSIVGDGDLGLTMSDGFAAANASVQSSEETDIGKLFYMAGKSMSTAVPSTMGTLMASGLMQAGKALKGKIDLQTDDIPALFEAFMQGVQERGKAKLGEKTFIDGMSPAVEALKAGSLISIDITKSAEAAVEAARKGSELTKTMIAVHGRAATRGEKSRELLDPGSVVAVLIMQGFLQFCKKIK